MSGAGTALTFDARPVEKIPVDLLVSGVFASELPLRGTAGRADWRLCGWLSDLARRDQLTGSEGEFVLISGDARLACERLLLRGLGERQRYDSHAFQAAVREICERSVALQARSLAVGSLGIEPDDWVHLASHFVEGLAEGLGGHAMEVRLSIAEEEGERVGRELVRCCRGTSVRVDLPARERAAAGLDAAGERPGARR